MKETKIHCAFFFFFAMSIAILFVILPIMQPEPRHPYSSWYPFEVNNGGGIIFYVTAVYEAICLLTMALLNVSTDVFIYSLIGLVHYQIQLLGHRLTQIGWNVQEASGHSDYRRNAYFKRLIECISLHQEINRLVGSTFIQLSRRHVKKPSFCSSGSSWNITNSSTRLFLCTLLNRLLCFR